MFRKKHPGSFLESMAASLAAVHKITGSGQASRTKTKSSASKSASTCQPSLLWDVHVKHPPSSANPWLTSDSLKRLPSLYRDGAVDEWGRIPLDDCQINYKRTGDHLLVLEAFVLAHREKLYPPLWVLDKLNAAFEKYFSSQGSDSLEQLLHLTGLPKQGSSFKQRAQRRRDKMLAEYIALYAALKPCSLQLAAHRVANHWEAGVKRGLYKFGYGLDKPLSSDTLLQCYRRRWRKQFLLDEKYMDQLPSVRELSKAQKEQFLKTFES